MTPEQSLYRIQQELALNEELRELLVKFSKHYADTALRKNYSTNDAAMLIRQSGMAEGVEQFIKDITKAPKLAQK